MPRGHLQLMETTPRVHPSSLAPNTHILPQDASVWCLQGDKLALLCHKELLPRLGLQPPLQPMHGGQPRCIELQRGRLADVSSLNLVLPCRRERDGHVAGSASQRCVVARWVKDQRGFIASNGTFCKAQER